MIIEYVNKSRFHDAFEDMNRKDNFSYEGLEALYDHYNDIEPDNFELDVIAICCEWSEYDTPEEAYEEYQLDDLEDLQDHTTVIELDNGHVLVQSY